MAAASSTLFFASALLAIRSPCLEDGRPAFVGSPGIISNTPFGQLRQQRRRHRCFSTQLFAAPPHNVDSRPRVFIEEAEDGFVDHEENLEEGEMCIKAVKAFAKQNDEKLFLCAGALVRRPPSPITTNTDATSLTIYDAWTADAIMSGKGGPNLQVQGAMCVLDDLYRLFLSTCADRDSVFVIQCGRATSEYTCASYSAALSRGFRPIEDMIAQNHSGEGESESSFWHEEIVDGLVLDPALCIERYTNLAWYHRKTSQGDVALDILGNLSSLRKPFVFGYKEETLLLSERLDARSTVVSVKQILPSTVVSDVNLHLKQIEQAGLLDDDLDSVDNQPSNHISLMSNGQNVVEEDSDAASILSIVKPFVEGVLLCQVRTATNNNDVQVSDIFLRTYSTDDESVRCELDAHYDCFNFATAVIPLDDTASDGTNGLYTLLLGSEGENGSSHSALRRYVPLLRGDAVIHSWRVKHGVKVHGKNQKRSSLVIWFNIGNDEDDEQQDTTSLLPPSPTWLAEGAKKGDDVAQFVLASAMESLCFYCGTDDLAFSDTQTWSMQELHPHDLLINSASQGNADALARLGTICQERDISDDRGKKLVEILAKIRPAGAYGTLDSDPLELDDEKDDKDVPDIGDNNWRLLARKLWFEAAMRGNPSAQIALGDEALDSTFPLTAEALLMAKTFYSLAAHQGDYTAKAALSNLDRKK